MNTSTLTHPSPTTGPFSIGEWLRRQPRWLVIALLGSNLLALGWCDYITGWEWSLSIVYLVPILLAVEWGGRTAGVTVAVLSSAIWFAANEAVQPYHTQAGFATAVLTRTVYFIVAAIGGAAIRHKQTADAAYIDMLVEQRRLEQDIVAVSEHEQQRIGRDLHDGLCQQLAAIGCAAKSLADDLRARGLAEALDAAHIEESIQEAVLEARGLARGIFPVHVDRSGLSAALAELHAGGHGEPGIGEVDMDGSGLGQKLLVHHKGKSVDIGRLVVVSWLVQSQHEPGTSSAASGQEDANGLGRLALEIFLELLAGRFG